MATKLDKSKLASIGSTINTVAVNVSSTALANAGATLLAQNADITDVTSTLNIVQNWIAKSERPKTDVNVLTLQQCSAQLEAIIATYSDDNETREIEYADKYRIGEVEATTGVTDTFRAVDANEVKTVVNNHAVRIGKAFAEVKELNESMLLRPLFRTLGTWTGVAGAVVVNEFGNSSTNAASQALVTKLNAKIKLTYTDVNAAASAVIPDIVNTAVTVRSQSWTTSQKTQARQNIFAASMQDVRDLKRQIKDLTERIELLESKA